MKDDRLGMKESGGRDGDVCSEGVIGRFIH